MRIKICGITDVLTAQAIAQMGVDTLGFICVPQSPRYVSTSTIKEIVAAIPAEISTVGVFVNASVPEIKDIVDKTGLSGIQLHGDEKPEICAQLHDLLPNIEIIKAWRLKDPENLKQLEDYYSVVDTLLLDAYQADAYGGTGVTLNWDDLTSFRPPRPWLLAGGITPDNVLTALNTVSCDGVDVSSGVEIAPGKKDLEQVNKLLQVLEQIDSQLFY